MSHLNLTFKGALSIKILAKPNFHFGRYFKIINVMQKHCLGGFVWVDTRNIEINTETSDHSLLKSDITAVHACPSF